MSSLKTIKTSIEYKMLSIKRRKETKNYEKQSVFFNEIIKYIQTTISSENVNFIQKVVTHSYNFLIILQKKLASINST